MAINRSPRQRLALAAKRMIYNRELAAYGIVLMAVDKHLGDDVDTSGLISTGLNKTIKFNPKFVEQADMEDILGVYIHNLLHVMFFHPETLPHLPNKKVANLAADLIVNRHTPEQYLLNTDKSIPEFLKELEEWKEKDKDARGPKPVRSITFKDLNMDDPKYRDMSLKELYDVLDDGLDGGLAQGQGIDALPADFLEKTNGETSDDHGQMEVQGGETEEELSRKQTEYMIKQVAKHEDFQKSRGTFPGDIQAWIEKALRPKKPAANWRALFRNLAGSSSKTSTKTSRRRPSIRHPESPRIKVHELTNVLFAVDTSGSVSNKELKDCYAELDMIHEAGVGITVIQADTQITDISDFEDLEVDKIAVHGRGGTTFGPVVEYYNKSKGKYSILIYFTDGHAPVPNPLPERPMVWLLSANGLNKEQMTNFPGKKIKITNPVQDD